MLANSIPSVSDSAAQIPSAAQVRSGSRPAPVSDDGAKFAMTLVLVVTALLGAAAAAADWLQRLG
jgi:hypothetical protein